MAQSTNIIEITASVVYVTQSPTSSADSKSSSANVGGIVAGVVVGVVVLLAVAGGFIFWHRRRRNQEIEEEHRRNAAVNAFMKPPGSSGGYSVENDSRMDPVMAQRRLSSGSIADNEDYSRRILRVRSELLPTLHVFPEANSILGHQRMRSLNHLRRTISRLHNTLPRHQRRFGFPLKARMDRSN